MVDSGRKGLVEGLGRDVLGIRVEVEEVFAPTIGENLEGTVPALALLPGSDDVLPSVSDAPFSFDGMKSGKPSWLGDSGIVSLNGVDPPLAGGPQSSGALRPSCAWISRALQR